MSLLQGFTTYVKKSQLFSAKDTLLLAVSGGVDSVVLCHLCKQAGYNFAIAHCNFKLRGAESDRDEAFVKELATTYNVPFYIQAFDTTTYAINHKKSIQVAARELRYQFFNTLLLQKNITYLLTAHHANDNVETVVMNFFKGTGINGMRGIEPKNKQLIRPLLFATRSQIENYAAENDIAFVADSSNSKTDYTRNYLRNEWLPLVEKIYPQVTENIIHNIERFADVAYLYHQSMRTIIAKLLTLKPNGEIHIPVLKLQKAKPLHSIIYEIISAYYFTAAQVTEVEKLLTADTGKYITSATHRILKNREWLIISSTAVPSASLHFIIEKDVDTILFDNKTIHIATLHTLKSFSENNQIAYLNTSDIQYPLILRKHKQGDYFYPLGMSKKKKLNRFFIDKKLSVSQKENIWVLEDAQKRILWVVGYRIDNRFKVNLDETNILKLSLVL